MSLYNISVPAFLRTLEALTKIIDKATAHVEAKKIDPAALLSARLFPDMFPFTKQVQIACDFAAKTTARLAGADVPTFVDTETSFAELKQRIKTATDYVKGFKAEQFKDSATRVIKLPIRGNTMELSGEQFLAHFALPNFYFHSATAYDILRHNGLELGKGDFLNAA
jgi:hypothetical protein